MVYQKQVFREIRGEIKKHSLDYAKKRVVEYQKRLYALDLEGKINYYAQDQYGIPEERIFTVAGDDKFYSTMLIGLKPIKKPKNFNGGAWPPHRRDDLLGCKSQAEWCAECEKPDRYDDSRRNDDYFNWVLRKIGFWHENINIRKSKLTGFGLYARHHIPEGTYIGEYTGIIIPWTADLDDSQTSYHIEMDIGRKVARTNMLQPVCWIDATKKGSIFRFMNHSCEPNAAVEMMRCGLHNRINVVMTIRPIGPGELITIDYGKGWFEGDENPCYCGAKKCTNKPKALTPSKVTMNGTTADHPHRNKNDGQRKRQRPHQ